MKNLPVHMGIDYGAKLAGTTAAAMVVEQQLQVWQIEQGQDADAFILNIVKQLKPAIIFIDAPLTLPVVYGQAPATPAADFFYRAADREVQAMSPMFIGGLTARAIKLRTQLAAQGTAMLETYPAQLVRLLLPQLNGYKKNAAALPSFADALQQMLPYTLKQPPKNWHQLECLLAWYSGYRHLQGQAQLYGDAAEGRIIV
ncbi:DUF429 domain-containing protein [Pontibacter sp. 172403-2]|uniref:DUF429 domain-containing protein n=1 Tax=Pontibacter rufus TaxID=2791028 RepID=UPI0018AF6E6D|nr:DUF429 domain-containing protein [Pontibacter sp. 172403-2]MBF9254991.1 DUF429 domain-containing protein [Pontibacter sp. 172403-2]